MIRPNEGLEIVRFAEFKEPHLMEAIHRAAEEEVLFHHDLGRFTMTLVTAEDYWDIFDKATERDEANFRSKLTEYAHEAMDKKIEASYSLQILNPTHGVSARRYMSLRVGAEGSAQLEQDRLNLYTRFGQEDLFKPKEHNVLVVSPKTAKKQRTVESILRSQELIQRDIVINPAMAIPKLPLHKIQEDYAIH